MASRWSWVMDDGAVLLGYEIRGFHGGMGLLGNIIADFHGDKVLLGNFIASD